MLMYSNTCETISDQLKRLTANHRPNEQPVETPLDYGHRQNRGLVMVNWFKQECANRWTDGTDATKYISLPCG